MRARTHASIVAAHDIVFSLMKTAAVVTQGRWPYRPRFPTDRNAHLVSRDSSAAATAASPVGFGISGIRVRRLLGKRGRIGTASAN